MELTPNSPAADYLLNTICEWREVVGEDRTWVVDSVTGSKLQYSEIEPLTRKIGSALTKLGFKSRDVLLFSVRTYPSIYAILLAVWRLNGITWPSYVQNLPETVADYLQQSKCRFIVCDANTLETMQLAIKRVDWKVTLIFMGEDSVAESNDLVPGSHLFADDGEAMPTNVKVNPKEDIMTVYCTSGSTGASKGAAYTHFGFLSSLHAGRAKISSTQPRTVVLNISSSAYVTGCMRPFVGITKYDTSVIPSVLTPKTTCEAVETYCPQVVFAFPTYLMWLVNSSEAKNTDMSSIKLLPTTGMPIIQAQINLLKEKLPNLIDVFPMYGASECFSALNTMDKTSNIPKLLEGLPLNSAGKPPPSVQVKIIDPETGEEQPPNEPGELIVKSDWLMKEYYGKPKETSEALQNGWYHTGDKFTCDENGFFYFVGRCKEIFKYYNNHISPAELEDIILKLPSVKETCVIGIPDPEGGDTIPKAYVVLKSGATLVEKDITDYVKDRVANYKQLRGGVTFVDAIPVTMSGKHSRRLLLRMHEEENRGSSGL